MKQLALLFLFLLAACGQEPASGVEPSGTAGRTPARFDPRPIETGPLAGLTLTLELERSVLGSGEQVHATLVIENNSDAPVTDPRCLLGSPKHGIVPADDPNAELEYQAVVDCAGPHTFGVGAHEEYGGELFQGMTIYGDRLPPGEYVAAMQFQGASERVEAPLTIED